MACSHLHLLIAALADANIIGITVRDLDLARTARLVGQEPAVESVALPLLLLEV